MTTSEPSGRLAGIEETGRPILQIGWLAKGLLFVIIGLLAMEMARDGYVSDDADQTGALSALASAPAGRILVLTVSVGLLLYAAWQVWTALADNGTDPLQLSKRIGWVGLAVVYALLAETGLRIGLDGDGDAGSSPSSSSGGTTDPTTITSWLLGLPGGRLVVIVVGVGVGVVAAYHLWKGLSGDYLDDIVTRDAGEGQRLGLRVLGAVGFVARASVLAIGGWLFVRAGRSEQPGEAAGMDETLRTLSTAPLGQVLLGLTGAGLAAAGLYDMVTFRRQRIEPAEED